MEPVPQNPVDKTPLRRLLLERNRSDRLFPGSDHLLIQIGPKPIDEEGRKEKAENDNQRVKSAVMVFILRLPDGSFQDRLLPFLRLHTYKIGKTRPKLFPHHLPWAPEGIPLRTVQCEKAAAFSQEEKTAENSSMLD